MKSQGSRIAHLREKVLSMTRQELSVLTGISNSSLFSIETDAGGSRSLKELIEKLDLNSKWVETGKGEIFASGTESENVARIKAGTKPADASPYRDELINELKRRAEAAEADKIKLQSWLDRILNGNVNFLKPLDRKAPYAQGA